MHGIISGFLIMFHWSIFLFLCQYHTVLKTVALEYSLKSGKLIPTAPFFFFKIALAIWDLLCHHTNLGLFCCCCPNSVKNALGNLIGTALNLWITLGSIIILTELFGDCHHHPHLRNISCLVVQVQLTVMPACFSLGHISQRPQWRQNICIVCDSWTPEMG